MKKGILIIFILSLLFTSCSLFKSVMNENGRKYYINKKNRYIRFPVGCDRGRGYSRHCRCKVVCRAVF